MRDPRTTLSGWLRGLFGTTDDGSPRFPGRSTRSTGGQAVIDSESMMTEVLGSSGARGFPLPDGGTTEFGRPVVVSRSDSATGCIATTSGLALTGVRAAAFLNADALPRILEPLRAAVARRTPLVVHASAFERGHGGYHAVAGSGAFALLARDAQQAVDLAVAARFIAEHSLTPGIVAIDGPEVAESEADVLLPDPGLIRDLIGDPSREIECPTPSQQMLFGDRRRTLPRWFDPDRPTALGVLPVGAEFDAAVAGRRAFFADHVVDIAEQALEALGRLTGRPLPRVTRFPVEKFRHVVVAQGVAIDVAERVAETLRRQHRARVGVLGVIWNRPFPEREVRDALADAEIVTVLERVDESETDLPPLLRDVEAATRGMRFPVLSATFDVLDEARVEAVFRNMESGDAARRSVRLGVAPPPERSEYPKRQVMLQAIRRDYPALGERVLAVDDAELERPRDDRTPDTAVPAPSELPWVVRQFEHAASTYDSVPRFWGEFTEPRREGGEHSVADPYLALGAVPACTATFHDRAAEREQAPAIDPSRCTACGKCWTSCPDSSIAPVALGTEALLNAAFDAAVGDLADDPAAGKLRRAHKQLATRIDGTLAKREAATLTVDILDESYAWLVDKMGVEGDERRTMDELAQRTRTILATLALSATVPLFHAPHRESKGSGTLLMLAINPRTCQGCGVCGAVCSDGAIEVAAQTSERVEAMRSSWRAWETLPDTDGATVGAAAENPAIGPLPAILMSRHCLFSVTGADGAEKGSGERLAARQTAAVVEFVMQRRVLQYARDLEGLGVQLREAIARSLADALPADDLDRLERAVEEAGTTTGRTANLGDVVARLEDTGDQPGLDAVRVRDLTRVTRAIENAHWRATSGLQGVGRARYGLVIAGRAAARWAAMFPRNPFAVPVTVDLAGEGPDLATGIVKGTLAEMVEEVREVRRAHLLLENPADLPARQRDLETMTWRDLTPEELARCPPVLVLAGSDALEASGVAALSRLLACRLPVKLVLLDDRDIRDARADPALLALAHRGAFVLSASPAFPRHLYDGISAALEFGGPALIHLHAPSPSRDGFASERVVERARLAVETRVHPLLGYDPGAEGVFGSRLSLGGNPSPSEAWVAGDDGKPRTPAEWVAGERRFDGLEPGQIEAAVRNRGEHWATLQELAGVVTPFTDRVRDEIRQELAAVHGAEIEDLRREYEERLAAVESSRELEHAARLKARLMQLAGIPDRSSGGDGEGGASS